MAELDFSDLIPAAKAAGGKITLDFSDLVPAKPAAPVDPAVTSYVGDVLSGEPTRARSAMAREQGRQAGSKAGAAGTFGVGIQAGALANFNDEIAGASRASGLPDYAPPLIAAPVGAARMGLDALGVTSGQASQDYADQRDYVRGYQEAAHEAHPVADIAGSIAGGLALPVAGLRAGAGLAGTVAHGMKTGIGYGALAGAGSGEDAGSRLEHAAIGASVGGALGGAMPLAAAAARPVVAPIASNIAARIDPTGYAERQIARAATRSGQTTDEIGERMGQAAADGQDEYRLLDALGYDGARAAAVVAKNPGEGRTQLRSFLDQRQEGQAYRVGNTLAEGLDAPVTAQRATADMTAARRQMDNEAFGAARADAEAVNVSPIIERIDETLRPGLTGQLNLQNGIAYDSVEGALARARSLLTDGRSQVTDFEVAQRARGDIADAVEKAVRAGEGNKARLLRQVRVELDQQLEAASPGFRNAMGQSRAAAKQIEAVETGTTAAGRGRTEDKIETFAALTPAEQAGFRVGYADPLIAKAQNSASGANVVRPYSSQAMQAELPAFAAPGRGDQMMRKLDREGEMFANRAEAVGNSKTAENLADNADTGIDAGLLGKLLSGNFVGATREALTRGAAALNGNTEAVRSEMARLLMEGDRSRAITMLIRLGQQDAKRASVGAGVRRGVLLGSIPAVNSGPREQPTQAGSLSKK